jgi:hypothetical protein
LVEKTTSLSLSMVAFCVLPQPVITVLSPLEMPLPGSFSAHGRHTGKYIVFEFSKNG